VVKKRAKQVKSIEQADRDGLTAKEQTFVNAYLGEARFNATDAARMAGYKGSANVLHVSGSRLLRSAKVSAVVRERMNEAAMSANEVLARLSDIASGRLADCLDEDGKFNLKLAKQRGTDQLLKKLKIKRTSKKVDTQTGSDEESETLETSLLYEEVEFEMYSALEALRDLGKYHKLFTEKHEVSGANGQPLIPALPEGVAAALSAGYKAIAESGNSKQ